MGEGEHFEWAIEGNQVLCWSEGAGFDEGRGRSGREMKKWDD